jgi:hypothetical protein
LLFQSLHHLLPLFFWQVLGSHLIYLWLGDYFVIPVSMECKWLISLGRLFRDETSCCLTFAKNSDRCETVNNM